MFGIVFASTLLVAHGPAADTASPALALEPTSCAHVTDFSKLDSSTQARYRCGRISVPLREEPAAPGRRLTLSYVAIAPQAPSAAPPLLMLHGATAGFVRRSAQPQALGLATDRMVVRFDLRGVDTSGLEPCRETAQARANVLGLGLKGRELQQAWYAPFRACRDAMRAAGFEADHFGAANHVLDAERVRAALGIERWHVYGSSYGTTVAMDYAAKHPDRVVSLVLDGPYPPDPTPVTLSESLHLALAGADAHCRATQRCGASSRTFTKRYWQAVDTLDRQPMRLTLSEPEGARPFVLNGEAFGFLSRAMLYGPVADGPAQRFVNAVLSGDVEGVGPMVSDALRRLGSPNDGTFAMNECRDRPRYRTKAPTYSFAELLDMRPVCPWWTSEVVPPRVPARGAVPSLVISSTSDPGTPTAFAEETARRLGTEKQVVIPGAAHGASPGQPCALAAITAFLHDPGHADVNGACAAEPAK